MRIKSNGFDFIARKLAPQTVIYVIGNKSDIEPKGVQSEDASDFAQS
jgi:hypothetical protein